MATDEIATLTLNLPAGIYFIRNDNREAKVAVVK
jgi:hypothetical protein